jgi:hypothetical protein
MGFIRTLTGIDTAVICDMFFHLDIFFFARCFAATKIVTPKVWVIKARFILLNKGLTIPIDVKK